MAETSEGYRTRFGTVSIEEGVVVHRTRIGSFRKRDVTVRREVGTLTGLRRFPGGVTLYSPGDEAGYPIGGFTFPGREVTGEAEREAFIAELVALKPALGEERTVPEPTPTSSAPSAPEIQVKSYKDGKEYAHDAQRMSRAGWQVMSTADQDRHTAVGRTLGKAVLTGGAGLLLTGRSKKGDQVVVTWVRGQPTPESAPQPLPASPPAAISEDVPAQIRKLADLHDAGIVTDEEFAAKKADLLARM
jgi:hypothetical protein